MIAFLDTNTLCIIAKTGDVNLAGQLRQIASWDAELYIQTSKFISMYNFISVQALQDNPGALRVSLVHRLGHVIAVTSPELHRFLYHTRHPPSRVFPCWKPRKISRYLQIVEIKSPAPFCNSGRRRSFSGQCPSVSPQPFPSRHLSHHQHWSGCPVRSSLIRFQR